MSRLLRLAGRPAVWVSGAFLLVLGALPYSAGLFGALFPDLPRPLYSRASFLDLALSHAALVGIATLVVVGVGIGVGIFVTRPVGRDFAGPIDTLTAVGQTFPPTAVLALAVPAMGYGGAPTVMALIVYGLLPVVSATIAGLNAVPRAPMQAADGIGLSPGGRLLKVELPLAAPVILSGVRTSVVLNIGTATIGSTVGALTLGSPIIEGLSGSNPAYVIQGAVLVGLFAVAADLWLDELERALT
ncbi:ABC transporter permease [Ancylobacter oerskovii]|uniref:ABC transporter permease n=1 Tax=Ancylobacter oerskovii TaxID=459519 RepID=A0ABW4YTR9_9HYPH|nr:ABC transporter permease [Ancylobacter oerskovii]MBS7543270.1 ABC transporter permease [Ancylobacter oerskovii]